MGLGYLIQPYQTYLNAAWGGCAAAERHWAWHWQPATEQ
jgi:hypothetical protein